MMSEDLALRALRSRGHQAVAVWRYSPTGRGRLASVVSPAMPRLLVWTPAGEVEVWSLRLGGGPRKRKAIYPAAQVRLLTSDANATTIAVGAGHGVTDAAVRRRFPGGWRRLTSRQ